MQADDMCDVGGKCGRSSIRWWSHKLVAKVAWGLKWLSNFFNCYVGHRCPLNPRLLNIFDSVGCKKPGSSVWLVLLQQTLNGHILPNLPSAHQTFKGLSGKLGSNYWWWYGLKCCTNSCINVVIQKCWESKVTKSVLDQTFICLKKMPI